MFDHVRENVDEKRPAHTASNQQPALFLNQEFTSSLIDRINA